MMCHFRAQNDLFAPNKTLLVKTINITFIYLLTPFSVQNFKKIFTADLELWECTIFGPKTAYLPKCKIFQETC